MTLATDEPHPCGYTYRLDIQSLCWLIVSTLPTEKTVQQLPKRPAHLPDFRSPPLNEVVIGVQFSTPKNYHQIFAGKVWDLFKDQYPKVQDTTPLPPSFETFGLPGHGWPGPQFRIGSGATHDRFWFLRQDGAELIQFQQDRLLHNWRKSHDASNEYPRFEKMILNFEHEAKAFEGFVKSLGNDQLEINQAEITYINHIEPTPNLNKVEEAFNLFNFGNIQPEDFSLNLREVLLDLDGQPCGRFICELTSGMLPNGKKVYLLNLTVKGAPSSSRIEDALKFIHKGREIIVQRFASLTSDQAHKLWERTK